jgi:hypothetical protein
VKIEIYGSSDDIISLRVNGKDKDEFGGYISGKGVYSRSLLVSSIGSAQAVRVHAIYDGCWSFAIGQVDEDRRLPDWSFAIGQEHSYSTCVTIDTGAEMATVKPEGEDV